MKLSINGFGVFYPSPASVCVDWRKCAPGAEVRVVGRNSATLVGFAASTLAPTLEPKATIVSQRLRERDQNRSATTI